VLRASHIDHHVGSAPVVTGSPWERQHSYLGESPEAPGFRLGSLGNAGFHGSWQLHPPDLSSNMFSHVGGNVNDLTSSVGQGSPKQLSHVFPGRLPMTSMSKFDSTNERMRNLYHRRSEANNNNADKKQYELDLGRILRGEDNRTTLMIKNIPNKYFFYLLVPFFFSSCTVIFSSSFYRFLIWLLPLLFLMHYLHQCYLTLLLGNICEDTRLLFTCLCIFYLYYLY
jgi:hypothetical protein